MLASLLPGLRDIRTPLAAGYLWIVATWLLLHNVLPKTVNAAAGPVKSIFELGGLLGNTAVLAGLSFVAYLAGSMLAFKFGRKPSSFIRNLAPWRWPLGSRSRIIRYVGLFVYMTRNLVSRELLGSRLYRQLITFVLPVIRELPPRIKDNDDVLQPDAIDAFLQYRRRGADPRLEERYVQAIITELPAVGIQLQAQNRDFWDTYDRQSAEAQFRFGISPPIVAIIAICAWQSKNFWWLLLLVIPIYLIILGIRESTAATSTLVQAVVLRLVRPPVLERLAEQVEKADAMRREIDDLERKRRVETMEAEKGARQRPSPGDPIE